MNEDDREYVFEWTGIDRGLRDLSRAVFKNLRYGEFLSEDEAYDGADKAVWRALEDRGFPEVPKDAVPLPLEADPDYMCPSGNDVR